jgi:hypothetical protein
MGREDVTVFRRHSDVKYVTSSPHSVDTHGVTTQKTNINVHFQIQTRYISKRLSQALCISYSMVSSISMVDTSDSRISVAHYS